MSKLIELAREAGLIAAKAEFSLHDKKLTKFYELSRADLEAELAAATNTNAKHVDLILRLEAENTRLRDALKRTERYSQWMQKDDRDAARAALGETK